MRLMAIAMRSSYMRSRLGCSRMRHVCSVGQPGQDSAVARIPRHSALVAQRLELLLELSQLPDPRRYVADVFVEQRVDVPAVFAW